MKQLVELSDYKDRIEAVGFRVVVIMNEDAEKLTEFELKYDIPYLMLSDENSAVIRQLGVFNPDTEPGTKYYGIPYPGAFIIDSEGVIRAKFAEQSYRDRPMFDDLLSAAIELAGPAKKPHE